jgi:Icc-related predicted phosphoesterase
MKFVAISDTHGQHKQLNLPEGDVIIHAGDISKRGLEYEIIDFLNWFKDLNYTHKVFIAGNHDFFFERASQLMIEQVIPANVVYLCDSEVVIEGIKIWGSPITPTFFNWAFNRDRGQEIVAHWDLIPTDVNILITHGPVYSVLDKTDSGEQVGCKDLQHRVAEIKPLFHICGHIHEAQGVVKELSTTFINASVLDENYRLVNEPIVFEM